MKKFKIFLSLLAVAGCIVSCDPSEKRDSLPGLLDISQLSYSVTQAPGQDNIVYLESKTKGAIPYWDYGSGTSTRVLDTISFAFAGTYTIKYAVSASGGFVGTDSTTITVSHDSLGLVTDPDWINLSNGQEGKTWVLNMDHPLGYYGLDYLKNNGSSDDWSWEPDYVGNEWLMANKDYGYIKFDLNGGAHYTKLSYDANNNPVNCNGTFSMNLTTRKMKLNGCELLYGGDFYSVVSDWTSVTMIKISADEIILGVLRDLSTDGQCYLGFRFKVKE